MTARLATKWKERAKEDRVNREQIKKNQKKILEDITREELLLEKSIKFCIENFDSEEATRRILDFIKTDREIHVELTELKQIKPVN